MPQRRTKRAQATVGVLPGWVAHNDQYLVTVIRGIQAAAQARGCHLLLGWGVGRVPETSDVHPAWPVASPAADFVPVGPWNTDGLLVFAPLLNDERSAYLQQLARDGHPVLFIATGEAGARVAVDNADGIHQAMAHLVEHGHRCIAFIAGDPNDPGDSAQRLAAYHASVAHFGLERDPRLVAFGAHSAAGGHAALQQIHASGVGFTAVVASDDSSAIGAMRALQAAGLRIPRDVAVIGFDDQPEALAQVPPLTSVRIPLTDIGYQALELLVDTIDGRRALQSLDIPARLMRRQSCGCVSSVILSAAESAGRRTPAVANASPMAAQDAQQALIDEMAAVFLAVGSPGSTDQARQLSADLAQAFAHSVRQADPAPFQTAVMELLQDVERANGNLHALQEVVSALRRAMFGPFLAEAGAEGQRLAEDWLHQARAAISESAERADLRHRFEAEARANLLSLLTARLSATLDDHQAVAILAENLPALGIRHAHVMLIEPLAGDELARSVVLSAAVAGRSGPRRFPSREFPPPGLYPPGERLNLALLPLVFQSEALGYVAFDAANLGPCIAIVRQLAATLKSARLHAQLVELSLTDALTGLHNRRYFELLLNNDVERSRRFRHGLSVIMVDLDRFKDYNDAFGHPAGDEALQRVARCLRDGRRKTDVVVRYGGEEFAILLPETDAADALLVAETIRAAVVNLAGLKSQLTVSLGVASLRERSYEAEELIDQADRALYEAKRTGRNRALVYQEHGAASA
jgi:diguanylate cyclase (GGDEF)-like protein